MKNVRTTLLGILMIVAAITHAGMALFDGDPKTEVDLNQTAVGVSGGIGLIMAREQAQHEEDKKNGTT